MSIATEIARLQQAKADLKASINAKGGNITNETLDQYASAVDGIQIAVELTQAQYDALTTPDTNTYYIVMEEE